MPAVSEEELQELREGNEKLRSKIAGANSKQAENEAARNREYEATQLVAEQTRLEAQLRRAEEASKVNASKDGAANVLEAAKRQLEQAEKVAEQPAGPVDTNAKDQPKNTTGATVAVDTSKEPEKSPTPPPSNNTNTNGGNS